MYYSHATRGFYDPSVHTDIPEGAVQLSDEAYRLLLEGLCAGRQIVLQDGQPALADPPPPSLDDLRKAAQAKVLAWATEFGARFTAGYTVEEVASWGTKAAAARAHLAGEDQPIIIAETEVTGEDPADLARTILAAAELYQAIVARITGLRRATMAAIDAAETAEAVEAALTAALASARGLAAQLGLDLQQEPPNA